MFVPNRCLWQHKARYKNQEELSLFFLSYTHPTVYCKYIQYTNITNKQQKKKNIAEEDGCLSIEWAYIIQVAYT